MKNSLQILSILLVLGTPSFSQTLETAPVKPKMIVFSELSECGERSSSVGVGDIFNCTLLPESNRRRIEHNGIALTVTFYNSLDFIAHVEIENKTNKKVSLDPAKWSIAYFKSEENFRSREKPEFASYALKPPPPVNGPDAPGMSDPFGNSTAGTMRQVTRTNRTTGETRRVMVRQPAIPRSSPLPLPKAGDFANAPSLTNKAISAKKHVAGSVYFPKRLDLQYRLVIVHIDGVAYAFPSDNALRP